MTVIKESQVCIVGGGPAGSMAALFLAKQGISCVLLEKEKFPRDKICGDALSGKVAEVLKKYDPELLDELKAFPAQISSWGIRFVAPSMEELKVPFKPGYDKQKDVPPGFISKRIDFDNFLMEKVKAQPQVDVLENAHVRHYEKTPEGFLISGSEFQVKSNLLIIADGAHSVFRRTYLKEKIDPKHFSAGIRAYYKGVKELDKDNFIELHFLKDFLPGYLWIFPLPNGQANVGIGMRSDIVSKRRINLKEKLKEFVKSPEFAQRFEGAELLDDVRGFGLPLGSEQEQISGDNYFLTGDAASLIDPFTGEGIGNALLSGMHAALTSAEALREGDFSANRLRGYDEKIYKRLGSELRVSTNIQRLSCYPWLFNLVVKKASSNKELGDMFSCMFTDVDLRKKLKNPLFYLKLLFS